MGWFSRKPKLQDQALSELAQMFASPQLVADTPTPGGELLDAARLDFTVASLGLVDDYLDQMRQRQLDDESYAKVVLRGGAYVGEVIRRHAKGKTFHWLDYQGAVKLDPRVATVGESLGSAAILWDGATGMSFPLAKVQKFLAHGREDSVLFFAKVMIEHLG